MERRAFLKRITLAIAAVIGALLVTPAAVFLVGPSRRRLALQEWIPIGAVGDVPIGVPTLMSARIEQESGWVTSYEDRSVYVVTEDGTSFAGLSTVCSHLGCRVRYVEKTNTYLCPCHNAEFSWRGDVLSGPPPRKLEHYPMKSDDGLLLIQFGGDVA